MADDSGFFDLSTATPVAAPSAPPSTPTGDAGDDGGFDLSTATPVAAADRPTTTLGREAGIGGRALLQGVADIEDAPRNTAKAVQSVAIWALKKAGLVHPDYQPPDPEQNIAQFKKDHPTLAAIAAHTPTMGMSNPFGPSASEGAQSLADSAGLPTAATPGERVYSRAVEGIPSAIFAPEAPVAGAISGGLSGGASQTAAEMGAGPGTQLAVGLAAGMGPAGAAAATRFAARGSSAANIASRVADADAAGTQLTVGQATGNPALQKAERVSQMGWGSGPLKTAADDQATNLKASVDDIATQLKGSNPNADISPAGTGDTVQTGLTQAKKDMKTAEKSAYDNVDNLVPPDTAINVGGTQKVLNTLGTPTPGAVATTGDLIPDSIARMRANMASDAPNGTMPYSAVVALRSDIGSRLNPMAQDQVEQGALKQIYKSLSADRDAGAASVSPQALQAVKSANTLYQQNSAVRAGINKILGKQGKTPEQIYQAATGSVNNGPTVISRVMSNLTPDQQNLLRAGVIKRMASAIPSKGGEEIFDPSTFLTKWDGMNTQAKSSLFGNSGAPAQWRQDLDSFVSTLKTLKSSKTLPNPSGTGDAVGHFAIALEMLEKAMHGVGGMATAGGTVALNYGFARAMTSPTVVRWLANTTKLAPAARATAITQLGRMQDPNAKALYNALQNPSGQQQPQQGTERVTHPDGRTGTIPASQLNNALAAGYTRRQPPEIQNQPDPTAAYHALPVGGAYTHNSRTLYKQGETRTYQGKTYRLRPGTDRTQPSNWDVLQ